MPSPSAVLVRASGRNADLFNDLTEQGLPPITKFLPFHADSPDVRLADAPGMNVLWSKGIARLFDRGADFGTKVVFRRKQACFAH